MEELLTSAKQRILRAVATKTASSSEHAKEKVINFTLNKRKILLMPNLTLIHAQFAFNFSKNLTLTLLKNARNLVR